MLISQGFLSHYLNNILGSIETQHSVDKKHNTLHVVRIKLTWPRRI